MKLYVFKHLVQVGFKPLTMFVYGGVAKLSNSSADSKNKYSVKAPEKYLQFLEKSSMSQRIYIKVNA